MIPSSRPKLSDLYTLSQSKLLENYTLDPFTAAHTYIAHIWRYPPGPKSKYNRAQCCYVNYSVCTG